MAEGDWRADASRRTRMKYHRYFEGKRTLS